MNIKNTRKYKKTKHLVNKPTELKTTLSAENQPKFFQQEITKNNLTYNTFNAKFYKPCLGKITKMHICTFTIANFLNLPYC